MQGITYNEIIKHYQIKLRELSDEIEDMNERLEKALALIEQGWSGTAAKKTEGKFNDAKQRILRTQDNVSHALFVVNRILGEIENTDL